MGAGSLDVIKPSAAGLVATTGAGRRPPPGCPPAGPVRVRGGGRSAAGGAGGPPGAPVPLGHVRPPALDPPPPERVFAVAPKPPDHLQPSGLYLVNWSL